MCGVIVQEVRVVGIGLDKSPFEELADGHDQHRPRDGIAHVLVQTNRLVNGEAGDQLRGEDPCSAQLRVHFGHVAVLAENRVGQHQAAVLCLAAGLQNIITCNSRMEQKVINCGRFLAIEKRDMLSTILTFGFKLNTRNFDNSIHK